MTSPIPAPLRIIVGRTFLNTQFSLFRISGGDKLSWSEGISLVFTISPTDFRLTENQRAYVDMVLNNQPEIDDEAIRDKLSELEYPIHFFDFETSNPAIPRFEGLNPYQQFPFQYSCHILQSVMARLHITNTCTPDKTDPRLPLVESLLDHISDVGSVVVYHASFERRILEGLAQSFPETF